MGLEGMESLQRSTTIDVIPPDHQRQAIIAAIRRYRAACRQLFAAVALAQQAGAEIQEHGEGVRVKPSNEKAKQLLTLAMDKEGKAFAYELRTWFLEALYPDCLSFVWDSARRDVATRWSAKDPEFTRAGRGWLVLQGARRLAEFNRLGIGMPRATARPQLDGHTLTLKWDHALGAVTFAVPRLDGGRYHVWKALRDGKEGWSLGTIYLTERDGKLFVTLSHARPAVAAEVDPERSCVVTFVEQPETWLTIAGPDGATTHDAVSAVEAIAWLARMRARREELERRKAACGNPRRPWGHRRGWLAAQDVLSRLTLLRTRGVGDRSHAWTRRIVSRAVAWRCGNVVMGETGDLLFGHPWNWSQFRVFLRYKCAERGMSLLENL